MKKHNKKFKKEMENNNYQSFIFRESWWNIIKNLPTKEKGFLLEIVSDYVFYNKTPKIDKISIVGMAFLFIQRDIEMDKNKYDNIKIKRSLAGKKGMDARWGENKTTKSSSELKEKKQDIDTQSSEFENSDDSKNENSSEKSDEKMGLQKVTKITNVTHTSEREKDSEILSYSLHLLSQGRPNAYSEAEKVYEYYEAMDWTTETIKPNGDKVVKKCKNHVSFLKAGTPKNEQLFSPTDGTLFASLIRQVGCKPENKDIIDYFRGFEYTDDESVVFLYTNIKAFQKFQKAFENNPVFNSLATGVLRKKYPNATSIGYREYKS